MKMLSSEVKKLLDKLYNLRGEDSVILAQMTKEREEAIATHERTQNEKAILLEKIAKLTQEQETLAMEGERLSTVLSSINRDDFANVLDRLNIDFDPASINEKIRSTLPSTIEKVVSENEKATQELENVETEMNNAITKVEELGIRKDEALNNQAKLNDYFELALDGNINITRDAITSLLEKFDFTENEQREAAKILMFPEDALYEYDASVKSSNSDTREITDALEAAKDEEVAQDTALVHEVNEDIEPIKISVEETSGIENAFESVMAEAAPEVEEMTVKAKDVKALLDDLNINSNMFADKDIQVVLENYDEEVITANIKALREKGINLDVLTEHPEIMTDKELIQKLERLLGIGKSSQDINLMPHILVKYDLAGLNNTINVLEVSGLDPKKVPLMAY